MAAAAAIVDSSRARVQGTSHVLPQGMDLAVQTAHGLQVAMELGVNGKLQKYCRQHRFSLLITWNLIIFYPFATWQKMKNLSKVKLVDASFIWTEPHSKRIKMKVRLSVCQ